MKLIVMKIITGIFAAAIAGCSTGSVYGTDQSIADISSEYVQVTAIDSNTITAVTGTVMAETDNPSAVYGSVSDQHSSSAKNAQNPEINFSFTSENKYLYLAIDRDVTVLFNGGTADMCDINVGDVLMLTYKAETLRAIEILSESK